MRLQGDERYWTERDFKAHLWDLLKPRVGEFYCTTGQEGVEQVCEVTRRGVLLEKSYYAARQWRRARRYGSIVFVLGWHHADKIC